jgi:hypothetical protein
VKFSNTCVELDALSPTELRRRSGCAIEEVMDAEAWSRAIRVGQVELQSMRADGEQMTDRTGLKSDVVECITHNRQN